MVANRGMLAVKVLGCGIRGVLQGAAERSTTKHHKAAGPLLRFAGSITHDRSTCSHILTKSKAAWQQGAWLVLHSPVLSLCAQVHGQ